ncbi:Hypothetical predicted protein [Olea europaea subsp. europaea]|uniref:Uncharacterized protein n=1 Tax=Olea europaea subsp. europaea TaxID=158383 RepID=A0A8S0V8K6_OLEEU|nr:Hypothetical predicted protein [Olea europaea subsp. europaea]
MLRIVLCAFMTGLLPIRCVLNRNIFEFVLCSNHVFTPFVQKNPKYGKFRYNDNSEIFHTYGKLFGATQYSTKYASMPTKLSQHGLNVSSDYDAQADFNDMLPINAETIDSSDGPTEGRLNSSMDIFVGRSGEKRRGKQAQGTGRRRSSERGRYPNLWTIWPVRHGSLHLSFTFETKMTDDSSRSSSSETDCIITSLSGSDEESDDDIVQQMEDDELEWLKYCRIAERVVRPSLRRSARRDIIKPHHNYNAGVLYHRPNHA